MSERTRAREELIDRALEWVLSDRAEPSANSDAQNEYDEERLSEAARKLVVALVEKEYRRQAVTPFADWLIEVVSVVPTLCVCQQQNIPAVGCAFCEGSGVRTLEVRRNGETRLAGGLHGWSEWRVIG